MVTEEMCMGPILCRTRTGECCSLEIFEGRVVCPLSCNIRRQSQKPGGFSLNDVFGVTFVTTLFYNVLTNIGATTTTTTVPTTATTDYNHSGHLQLNQFMNTAQMKILSQHLTMMERML